MADCTPDDSKGGCTPVLLPVEGETNCCPPEGGTKTVGIPRYVLVITNLPDPNAE